MISSYPRMWQVRSMITCTNTCYTGKVCPKTVQVGGVLRWKLRPKHHSLEEIGVFVEKTQVNPRFTVCFQDECFLGHLKRIGAKCHETTMLTRAFQRLTLLLSQRWKETRERAKHAELVLKQEKPMPSIAMHRADQPARAGGAMWLCENSSLPPNGNSNVGDDP